MKKIIIIITAVLLMGFDNNNPKRLTGVKNEKTEGNQGIFLYEVDGCEYIGSIGKYGQGDYLAHKGNCKFCEKRKTQK